MRFDLPLRKDRPFDVVGMGLNSIDFLCIVPEYPPPNGKMRIRQFARSGGGQVATALSALARWGVPTKYLGKVGGDELGRLSLETLRQDKIDVSSVMTEPGAATQHAMIIVDGTNGDRTILWDRDDRLMYRQGELSREDVCAGRLLHLDGHDIRAALQCARWAREEGIPSMVDVDKVEPLTGELLQEIDFVVTSARFPSLYTGIKEREKALLALAKEVPGFLCSTLGESGAIALVDGAFVRVPGFRVDVVDTTGAGDVFHGGFLYGLLRNWEIEEILRFANAAAGLKCRGLGGRPAIPTLDEIERLIRS